MVILIDQVQWIIVIVILQIKYLLDVSFINY
jgi:hypothetical protein